MQINVSVDIRKATRFLDDAARRQIPFATAKALTATADAARIAVTRSLPQTFDRPTPFTLRAIGIKAATKRDLTARVFVKDAQAKYLALEETGGTRTPDKGVALVMPKAVARNAFGNIPKGMLQRLKRQKNVFVGKPEGSNAGGFYRRLKNDKLQPLAIFFSKAVYRPKFGFKAQVETVARRVFPVALREALKQALATARR
ncbi:MAG: hypothetical protein IRZ07_03830 [Microbispora sp.]|nr:hypothetical protein [Microbispora sp.]